MPITNLYKPDIGCGFLIYDNETYHGCIRLDCINSIRISYDSSIHTIILLINDIEVYRWASHLKYQCYIDNAKHLVSKLKRHLRIQLDEDFNINEELDKLS